MNGIIVVNKPRGVTSRDVVNNMCKIFNTKKIGHTGTLDPIAEGVLVICIGKATKLVELITADDKEYIATVKLGVLTDTLDTDGKVLKEEKITVDKDELINVLNSFIGKYMQEVPVYSAVKINGKKLYEYARAKEKVELPKRNVEIKKVELLDINDSEYKFKVLVSKGTYIRSLIKDINDKLGIIGSMSNLVRTKQGIYSIDDAYKIDDIINNNYRLIDIKDAVKNYKKVIIDDELYGKVKNGAVLDNNYQSDIIVFSYNDNPVAIYKIYEKDKSKIKPYKMFV